MGLNANFVRMRVLPALDNNTQNNPKTEKEPDTNNKPQEPSVDDKQKLNELISTHTFFTVYEGITSRLGNFYSETLAKMTGTPLLNKRVFNSIYNGTLKSVVKSALESAKSGEKINFDELAQNVKDQITAELEACNYDPVQYQKNYITGKINNVVDRFNK